MIVFCHGLPGSPEDAALFSEGNAIFLDLLAFDPVTTAVHDHAVSCFDAALERIAEPVHLVGFSLGAMFALQIATKRPDQVSKITLISPAAPLELGNFLPKMAGRMVFKCAATHPWVFSGITSWQGILTRLWPSLLTRLIFAGSREVDLLFSHGMDAVIKQALRNCFVKWRAAYQAAISTYTQPWSADLSALKRSVEIWHGCDDDWAPLDMAYALQSHLMGEVTVNEIAALGHYGALFHWAKQMGWR